MSNKKLTHKISFMIDEATAKKIDDFNFEPRSILITGLKFLESQIAGGYTPLEINIPLSKMRKVSFILEAKNGND